jgi:hypothetical protein
MRAEVMSCRNALRNILLRPLNRKPSSTMCARGGIAMRILKIALVAVFLLSLIALTACTTTTTNTKPQNNLQRIFCSSENPSEHMLDTYSAVERLPNRI